LGVSAVSTDDADLIREQTVADIAHARCVKYYDALKHVRDFLARGTVDQPEGRSELDLSETRGAIESRVLRVGNAVSDLSTVGMDAQIGHLPLSKVIRNFWGGWTVQQLLRVDESIKSGQCASFQPALACVNALISEHEIFHRYLCDIRNKRDHGDDVLAFLGRHLESLPEDQVPILMLPERHILATRLGVGHILGVSGGHARRIVERLGLDKSAVTGRRGLKLYDIKSLVTRCRQNGVRFTETVGREFLEKTQLFQRAQDRS
jgi:hypothetical protein